MFGIDSFSSEISPLFHFLSKGKVFNSFSKGMRRDKDEEKVCTRKKIWWKKSLEVWMGKVLRKIKMM